MENNMSGILDNTSKQVVVLTDDKITLRSNVTVHGTLDVGLVRAKELIADQRYEKQFLEFAAPQGLVGSGLLWVGNKKNHQLILRNNPDRFWISDSVDLPQTQTYMIGGSTVLSSNYLGNTVTVSNLQKLGNLKSLTVNGSVNFADKLFFSESSGRLGLGIESPNAILSVYDETHDIELSFGTTTDGAAKMGTFNAKQLDIVTDNQSRISVMPDGSVTIGHEHRDSILRVYGRLSVGVKNSAESLEVAGNIKWSNRLFTSASKEPISGAYTKGDIVWNSEPKPNTYIGWVCTISGNPGKWLPFGLIGS
jgi:hypothetical protein